MVRQCGAGRLAVRGRRRRPAMGCELDATERARGRCTRLPVAHSLARWNAAVSFPLRHGREAGRSVCGTVCAGAKRCLRMETSEKRGKLRRASETAIAEPRQKQFAAGMRAMWLSGVIRRVLGEQGTRALVLAQCWLRGAGTCQRRRQCGGRSLCRCIRWKPKAAPTNRVPPVCAQFSARVRHRPSPCLAREVRRPED